MARKGKALRRTAFVPRVVFATVVGAAAVPMIGTACEDSRRTEDDDGVGGFSVAAVGYGGFSVAAVGYGGFSVAAVAYGGFGGSAGAGGAGGAGGAAGAAGSGGMARVNPADDVADDVAEGDAEPRWAMGSVGEGPNDGGKAIRRGKRRRA